MREVCLENRGYKTSSNCVRVSSLFSAFFVHKKVWKILSGLTQSYWSWFLLCLRTVKQTFFSYSLAVVYSAELSILLNDNSSLVTWQIVLCGLVSYTWSLEVIWCYFGLLLTTFELNIKIKVSWMQEDFIFNAIYKIW